MEKNPIIDVHVHVTPPWIIKNISDYRQIDEYFNLLCSSPVNKNVSAEEVIAFMQKDMVDLSIIFGFAFKDMEMCKKVNDYVIEKVNSFPEKLIGFAVINPLADQAVKELDRCKKAGLKGVGELFPAGQAFDLEATEQLSAVSDFCLQNNWPIMIHLNEPVGHYYKGKTEDSVQKGELLAKKFPEVKFIYSHLGGGLCFYELMPEVKTDLKNVYYDTAAVPFLYSEKVYSTLKSAGILDKIIFGTDYPLLSQEKYIRRLKRSDLNNSDIKKILFDNSNDILVLED